MTITNSSSPAARPVAETRHGRRLVVSGLIAAGLILCPLIARHPRTASAATALPNVTVTAPRPPTAAQLAGPSVPDFISHHAALSVALGQLTRWQTGVCPLASGLSPGFNAFVTTRIRAIAAAVGAPVAPPGHCKTNIEMLFTTRPQVAMDAIAKSAPVVLGMHYRAQLPKLKEVTHPIQGWYVTATRGYDGSLVLDQTWAHSMWRPGDLLDAGTVPACHLGSHLSTECTSQIINVFIVADTTKVAGYTIGSISDYLAVVALSMAQSLDTCDPLPSILDLMSPGCPSADKPGAITAGDLAFLKALYRTDLKLVPELEKSNIQAQMMSEFGGRDRAP